MLKPEAMQRVLIISAKGHQAPLIEALHDLRATHFIDYEERRDGEFAEFRMGAPLPQGAAASGRLVRVRALLRNLGLEGAEPSRAIPVRDLESRLDATLDSIESTVNRAVEARESLRNRIAEDRDMEAKLEPLRSLPLRLEDYRGYESLTVFAGRADPAWKAELPRAAPDALLVDGEGSLFALFVPAAQAQSASDLLYRHGYAEVEVPEGTGTPEERLRAISTERATLESRLAKAEEDLGRLAQEHRDFLVAAEEHLTIAVEKAEAPLAFASTDNAFVVDAWVPATQVPAVEAAVKRATKDAVYFTATDVDTHHHGHGHGDHGGLDEGYAGHPPQAHAGPAHADPPTKYANPRGVRRFQWFVDLFSTPRYDEADPTLLFAIFFPLFFGFMIGDLGLGLVMVGLGYLLIRKLHRVEGMKQLGTAILLAGVVAALLGGLVFKDALGIPLGVNHHMEDVMKAAGVDMATATCQDVYTLAHEPTWSCLFRGASAPVTHYEGWSEPLIYKVTDVNTMLLISVLAAGVHLLIGLLLGVRNELGHGAKHVGAKVGFLVLLLTFYPAVVALLRADLFVGGANAVLPLTTAQAYMVAGVGFVLGGILLGWAEGFAGVLEIPSILSAILSYLRLGAVAIAKGAMAVAFNALTLVAIGLAPGAGIGLFILGLIAFLLVQTLLLVLGLLSAGIQALRLNFVEFFTKFYKGGGTPFKPFGRERRYTAAATAGPAAGAAATASVLTPPLNP